jgi:hypothetical protein
MKILGCITVDAFAAHPAGRYGLKRVKSILLSVVVFVDGQ